MSRSNLLSAVALAFLPLSMLACSGSDARPPPSVGGCTPSDSGAPCSTTIGQPGTGTLDGAVTPGMDVPLTDAAPPDAATAISGTLRFFTTLPPGNVSTSGRGGWTMRALASLDADAGASPTLEATSLPTGAFTLMGIPPTGAVSSSGLPAYWIEANFPVMGGIGTVFELPADARTVVVDTIDDILLRTTLNSFGIVQADDRAVIAVFVRESRTDGARAVANRRATADGQASTTLYDNVANSMEVNEVGTGPRGFALLPNVAVPASGDGFVVVSVQGSPRTYQVRVRRGRLSWLLATSS